MLKRHLAIQHGLTPAGYRERFGLKPDYPMAAPNYTQLRREVAFRIGLEAEEAGTTPAEIDCAAKGVQIEPVGNNRGRLVTPAGVWARIGPSGPAERASRQNGL